MKSIITVLWLLVAVSTFAGTIVSHDIDSPSIAKNVVNIKSLRHVEVYLPSGYDSSNDRFPVLYWIPGGGQAADGFVYKTALDSAIGQGVITPSIVVFIDVQEIVLFLNSALVGYWEDFLVSELVPFIDKTYRTIPNAKARGLMGHSLGGYSALILPLLHPNVWGSIGLNDPVTAIMWLPLNEDKSDFQALKELSPSFKIKFKTLPKDLDGYISLSPSSWETKCLLQKGASFSPNPSSPILSDMPVTPDGKKWVQEIWEKWSDYDLTEAKSLAKYAGTLKSLSSIALVVPESVWTNRASNIYLIDKLQAAGVSITRLDMPGEHMSDLDGRFVALVKILLKGMQQDKK